jgi:hypothetical protein
MSVLTNVPITLCAQNVQYHVRIMTLMKGRENMGEIQQDVVTEIQSACLIDVFHATAVDDYQGWTAIIFYIQQVGQGQKLMNLFFSYGMRQMLNNTLK